MKFFEQTYAKADGIDLINKTVVERQKKVPASTWKYTIVMPQF